jgi:hypothetical protein
MFFDGIVLKSTLSEFTEKNLLRALKNHDIQEENA